MTLDQMAQFIGYVILYSGGVLLTLLLICVVTWAVIDVLWRRYGNWKLLREFMRWKRNGWSPFDKGPTV